MRLAIVDDYIPFFMDLSIPRTSTTKACRLGSQNDRLLDHKKINCKLSKD